MLFPNEFIICFVDCFWLLEKMRWPEAIFPSRFCLEGCRCPWKLLMACNPLPKGSGPAVLRSLEMLVLFWYPDYEIKPKQTWIWVSPWMSMYKLQRVPFPFLFSLLPPLILLFHGLQISSRPQPDFITITLSSWSSFNIWKDHLLTGNGQFFSFGFWNIIFNF